MSETSEKMGRCRREITAAYESTRYKPIDSNMLIADAIDRLAADVAAVKASVERIEAVETTTAVTLTPTNEQSAALRMAFDHPPGDSNPLRSALRDREAEVARLKAEVERLKAELAARQPDGNSPETSDSSPAAPQPAAKIEDSLDGLEMMVHAWAHTRKILSDSSPQAQMVKLAEEVGELAAGVCRNDRKKIIDAIGDTTVVLIVMCGILRLSFRRCLQAAYDEIRGRSGTIEGGVFVKAHAAPPPDGNFSEIPDSSPAAPQPAAPPPGWLTEEERAIVEDIASMIEQWFNLAWSDTDEKRCAVLRSILSRAGSPPVVALPTVFARSLLGDELVALQQVKDSLDKAGVAWKEV